MKKKLSLILMAVLLLVPLVVRAAQDSSKLSSSISIPITTGLVGNNNSAKNFLLDLPNGVNASAISSSSLKYSGGNEVIGSIVIENGKIKITLRGIPNSKTMGVTGYQGPIFGKKFRTNVVNSIWRYSDGRRWQINDYDEAKNTLTHYDKNATDSSMPSLNPPKTIVAAFSEQSTVGLKWFDSTEQEVDSRYVVDSSIVIEPAGGSSYLHGKDAKFKNGKIITNYTIGSPPKDPNDHTINWEFEDATEKATIPITGHVEGREYSAYADYYYKATAKLTTFSYNGKVTFDYSLPTEPNLIGTSAVLKPNPNPTQFENKDVPVQLSLKGDLQVYTDTSNISEWVFYAKEKGSSTAATKKSYSKTLSSTQTFDFTIDKSKLTGNMFSQDYVLTVTVRFTNPVLTESGSITQLSQTLGETVKVYKLLPSSTPNPSGPPPTPTPTPAAGKPPVAIINAPNTVKAGEEFTISGRGSYDPDGVIKKYFWDTPGIGLPPLGVSDGTWYPLESLGENTVRLTVVDEDGMTGSTGDYITVIEPLPVASLQIKGTRKQNRKVILLNTSTSPQKYPLRDELTKISIIAISGGTSSDIKYSGSLSGIKEKDMLFKQPGTYKATISVENTLGYKDTTSVTFDIQPDEPPTIYFAMQATVYRDPDIGNKAAIHIEDMSSSPDSDIIAHRFWQYRYDSDNDGSFEDESWVTLNDANLDSLDLVVSEVGRYEVKVTETEKFGQPTIDEFVTAADRRSADSYNSTFQPLSERIVEVLNRGPEVDWTW